MGRPAAGLTCLLLLLSAGEGEGGRREGGDWRNARGRRGNRAFGRKEGIGAQEDTSGKGVDEVRRTKMK